MLIIPFAKKADWKKPPMITIALVIVNILLFSFWQAGDGQRYKTAIEQYQHSSLAAIEFPRYEAFLKQQQRDDDAREVAALRNNGKSSIHILQRLQHDTAFLRALAAGEIVKQTDSVYQAWLKDRQLFEEKLALVVNESHTFKPAFPEISDAFTHMFMHGSIMHLVGNMVFLLIVGMVVERLLGAPLYFTAYISGGLIAVAFFAAGNSDSAIPLLGASGAIAAMMGMYAALFGARKIPFFYSLGFYFGTVRAPAYLLLLVWLGNEVYQFITNEGSHVAYLAHFGGLLGGGIMGYFVTYLQIIDPKDLEIPDDDEQQKAPVWLAEYQRAMDLLGRLEIKKAMYAFSQLQKKHPNEAEILWQFYKSAKYEPDSEYYHQSSLAILTEANLKILSSKQVQQVFHDYLELTQKKARLNREMLHYLGAYFLKRKCLDETRRIVMILIRNDASAAHTSTLALGLAQQLRLKKQLDEAVKLLKWLIRHDKTSAQATQARTLLQFIDEPS